MKEGSFSKKGVQIQCEKDEIVEIIKSAKKLLKERSDTGTGFEIEQKEYYSIGLEKEQTKARSKQKVYGFGDVNTKITDFHSDRMKEGEKEGQKRGQVVKLVKKEQSKKLIRKKNKIEVPESTTASNWVKLQVQPNVRIDVEAFHDRGALQQWQRVKLQPGTGQQGGWLFYVGDGKTIYHYSTDIMAQTVLNVAKNNRYLLVYPKNIKKIDEPRD